MPYLRHLSHPERLAIRYLDALAVGRLCFGLVMYYKIFNDLHVTSKAGDFR